MHFDQKLSPEAIYVHQHAYAHGNFTHVRQNLGEHDPEDYATNMPPIIPSSYVHILSPFV